MSSETTFIRRLLESGLLSAEEVEQFRSAGHTEHLSDEEAERLALALLAQGRLTTYQSTTLRADKPQPLVLGNYVVLDKLGQGGMGTVFRAEHRRMKRQVALKVMSSGWLQSPEAVERFRREVEVAARLKHPNIVAAYDADEVQGAHFLVMELVEGCDLAQLVKQQGPLPVELAARYILQAARGLEYAHAAGVVHRDIKPHNLMLDESGTVKVLDMGLARVTGSGSGPDSDSLTKSDETMGTVDYMAPEQALHAKHADQRSDIYSLGCALHYLLVGMPVYAGDSRLQKLLAHRDEPIPSLVARRPDVPAQLDAVFRKMIAKEPADRYPSMSDVIRDLELVLGAASVHPPSAEQVSARNHKWLRRPWASLGIAATVALLAVVAWLSADRWAWMGPAAPSGKGGSESPLGLPGAADRKLVRFRCLNCTQDFSLKLVMEKHDPDARDADEFSFKNLGAAIETDLTRQGPIEIPVASRLGTYFFYVQKQGDDRRLGVYSDRDGNAIPKNVFQHAYVTLRLSRDPLNPDHYKWEFEETNDEKADDACQCPQSEDGV